jgi:hypothetical protein
MSPRPGVLRAIGVIAVVAGAAASLFCMFRVGRSNRSMLLMGLFTIWVLAPFAGLLVADRLAQRWTPGARAALSWLTLGLALGAPALYGGIAFGPPRPKPAAGFLMVPLASLVILAIGVTLLGRRSRREAPW